METPPSELIAFSAVEEPRLIQASTLVTITQISTARTGIFQRWLTRVRKLENGKPLTNC